MTSVRAEVPREGGPYRRPNQDVSQYGAVEVLLSRQVLAGAVSTALTAIEQQLEVRLERSFNEEGRGCVFAYMETDIDAFTAVAWDDADAVEVWAMVPGDAVSRPGLPVGADEFARFLELARLSRDDVVIPFGMRSAPPSR